ncbi:hypothetical protein BpHYR1_003830 [Brachionus plicatilis]|uniref:Uncharacterized protein n=1 Tax=Brachionus plicatilis TaxID=10195 RepID=A0A3M7RTR2_BRAPC|nr:hypothetical protein BpHYR1_003830 [Brachionus plicatilis]
MKVKGVLTLYTSLAANKLTQKSEKKSHFKDFEIKMDAFITTWNDKRLIFKELIFKSSHLIWLERNPLIMTKNV